MEELRPDLLPVSSTTPSTGTFDTGPSPTPAATSNGSSGSVVGSGVSVISLAAPSQQSQQPGKLPPPSKGAVPEGVTRTVTSLAANSPQFSPTFVSEAVTRELGFTLIQNKYFWGLNKFKYTSVVV